MNAQNIVAAVNDLVANDLTVTQPSPVTLQERQMAEYLVDTVKLMASRQKVHYSEETTLDFDDFTDDEESEEEVEEMDEDWSDKAKALEKYGLKIFQRSLCIKWSSLLTGKVKELDVDAPGKLSITDFKL